MGENWMEWAKVVGQALGAAGGAYGLIRLWAKGVQDELREHAEAIKDHAERLTRMEAIQEGQASLLERVHQSLEELHLQIGDMKGKLGEILGFVQSLKE